MPLRDSRQLHPGGLACERAEVVGVANARNLEEYWIGSVGRTLYDKFILEYNKKMWLVDDNRRIDTFNWSPKGVTIKAIRATLEERTGDPKVVAFTLENVPLK